ncbi:hypothetical protein K2P47_04950 [Patescibacteria group bacterium]|nr:hypothetical protein [Patescibacteria group bacterium]
MPRARINDAAEDVVLPKPRARRTRVVSSDGVAAVARKRAAPKPRVTTAPTVSAEAVPRKAPTPLSQQRRSRSKKTKSLFVVIAIGLLLSGTGVVIGFMGQGEIDVVAVVNERNEKINKGEVRDESGNAVTQTIQVQTDTRPNGGLPMGDAVDLPPPPPVPEASTTTEATSTSETASSTEALETEATTTPDSV